MSSKHQSEQHGRGSAASGKGRAALAQRIRQRLWGGNPLHRIVIIVLAGLCLALYGWQLFREHELRTQLDQERATLKKQLRETIDEQAIASLRVAGVALGWAAADKVARNDFAAIDMHITRMVREKPVNQVAMADREGTIRVATNKKLEGQQAAAVFPGIPLHATEITVADLAQELAIVVPLVHEETPAGTAVLTFARGAIGAPAPATATPQRGTPAAPGPAGTPGPAETPGPTEPPEPAAATE